VPTLVAPGDIGYYPVGHPALRRAIADRYTGRGIRTGPKHILVTTGAQQALSLLARALLARGDRVLVEGPTYPGALEALREQAAMPRSLPVGLGNLAAAREQHAVLAYVISADTLRYDRWPRLSREIRLDADGADLATEGERAEVPVLVCRESSVRRRRARVSATRLRNIAPPVGYPCRACLLT
jgi:hypothetical protein